jgi:transcriptional regulator GlxA family with amidase domain
VLGRAGAELPERLWEVEGWERCFALLEAEMSELAARARRPSQAVGWAWGRMRVSGGRATIGGLAEELGLTHRRLIAGFREQVGLPPKALGRLLRFERVSRLLLHTPAPRLAEVAFDCGYYDQAPLNRDFREFAGTRPGRYLAKRLPDEGGVTG